jgi:hypothetical protein
MYSNIMMFYRIFNLPQLKILSRCSRYDENCSTGKIDLINKYQDGKNNSEHEITKNVFKSSYKSLKFVTNFLIEKFFNCCLRFQIVSQ